MTHPDYVHLHVHSEYSLLDGAIRRVDLADERHGDRPAVVAADDSRDQRPVGCEDQHLVPRFEQRAERGSERAGVPSVSTQSIGWPPARMTWR